MQRSAEINPLWRAHLWVILLSFQICDTHLAYCMLLSYAVNQDLTYRTDNQ